MNRNGSSVKFGYDFGDIAKLEFPQEAITELIGYVGNLFRCERVYIFEKNEQGSYDCTDEWVKEQTLAKKDFLQGLSAGATRYYYNYFLRDGKLIIRNMEDFKQVDYPLYKQLSPQDLKSVVVEQLVYEGDDRGFIGLDNPADEKFDELTSFIGVLSRYISILLHKRQLERKIHEVGNEVVSNPKITRKSIYSKTTELRKEAPLAVIYAGILVNGDRLPQKKIVDKAEKVLSSIFGETNVFPLHNGEFIIVYSADEKGSIAEVGPGVESARDTLRSMNIHLFTGIVATDSYEDNFFFLANQANTNMLRDKRAFRNIFISKYHMEAPSEEFSELLEIRPERGILRVLYQETSHTPLASGNLRDGIQVIKNRILVDDQEKYDQFVQHVLKCEDKGREHWESEFRLVRGMLVETIQVSVVKFKDMNGETVYLCYTL